MFSIVIFNFFLQGLGPNGLYKGVTATVARNAVFNGIYFGFYHTMKQKIPKTTVKLHVTSIIVKFIVSKKND